jgi:hypothetical protein
LREPPPAVTANVTWNLGITLPFASFTMTVGISSRPTVDDVGSVVADVIDAADGGSVGSVGKLSHVQRSSTVTGMTTEAFQRRTDHHPR